MSNIDLNRYKDFVAKVTSEESNETEKYLQRIERLSLSGEVNMALLDTAASGMCSESGEFMEIVKKIKFQGKEYNDNERWHMMRELGDVMWYWINACRALNADPNEVIAMNVEKLESRYPGGEFDVYYSENRQAGDL